MIFWGVFRWDKMGSDIELEDGKKVNSIIYRDHILMGLLQEFWEESFGDMEVSIMMEDNTPPHKKIYIPIGIELGIKYH
jgi:hypothetical protein